MYERFFRHVYSSTLSLLFFNYTTQNHAKLYYITQSCNHIVFTLSILLLFRNLFKVSDDMLNLLETCWNNMPDLLLRIPEISSPTKIWKSWYHCSRALKSCIDIPYLWSNIWNRRRWQQTIMKSKGGMHPPIKEFLDVRHKSLWEAYVLLNAMDGLLFI